MESLHSATGWINLSCEKIRAESLRAVPMLISDANLLQKEHMEITLPVSGNYLSGVRDQAQKYGKSQKSQLLLIPRFADDSMTNKISSFSKPYYDICSLERDIIALRAKASPTSAEDSQLRCTELVQLANNYREAAEALHKHNPVRMSLYLLNMFDLWMQADKCAISAYPPFRNHHPGFLPQNLDVLLLPLASDMQRLLEIQTYLQKRCGESIFGVMIADLGSTELFASHYVQTSLPMLRLKNRIEAASEAARRDAEERWNRYNHAWDICNENITSHTCKCTLYPNRRRNITSCTRCYNERKQSRLEVIAHEDFLPESESSKDAVIFELAIPEYLSKHRELTARLIILGTQFPDKGKPLVRLANSNLSQYQTSPSSSLITLASPTKSFSQTHYSRLRSKISLAEILLPCGYKFHYHAEKSDIWLAPVPEEITFGHLCRVRVPAAIKAMKSTFFQADTLIATTSYEVMASQTKCPINMPVHEFIAVQQLLCSGNLRWLDLLRELGSTNVNFGDEDTMVAITQLFVQAGSRSIPPHVLRNAHGLFKEEQFCLQLSNQLNMRLEELATNWREVLYMETMIMLSLRFCQLCPTNMRHTATELIHKARRTTLSWIKSLNRDLRNALDTKVVESALKYGWWAALLCRRTFSSYEHLEGGTLSAEDTSIYVQATIALRDYSVQDPATLSSLQKDLLIRDRQMSWKLVNLIQNSVTANGSSIGPAINEYWGDETNQLKRSYLPWQPLAGQCWITSTMSTITGNSTLSQSVLLNTLEGHLLVDGKVAERLPLQIQLSESVKQLFADTHNIHTFPSSLKGMTHQLQTPKFGNAIHFGLRDNVVIIQASGPRGVWEFIPKSHFSNERGQDLPSSLLDDCVHWFNLQDNCLEIRRKTSVWKSEPEDWILNLNSLYAFRGKSQLLSTRSPLCQSIAKIFGGFETEQRLTIYRAGNKICVDLNRLDLSFFVDTSGRLQCPEHKLEIDADQDAGTLYGLQSKIVLRSVVNPGNRSIFVRLGTPSYGASRQHVRAYTNGDDDRYCRFDINKDLGRLECPPDPQLLYTKALFHAITSLPEPDRLTRRTGTEESFHILRSAQCQPYSPLHRKALIVLKTIESLSPTRAYYPPDKRKLQSTKWNPKLTTTIQHDDFGPIVRSICQQSRQLQAFALSEIAPQEMKHLPTFHLQRRGALRRNTYERSSRSSHFSDSCENYSYRRDESNTSSAAVYKLVKSVFYGLMAFHTPENVGEIFQRWKSINGFSGDEPTPCSSLFDSIEDDIGKQFGNLLTFCQTANRWSIIFRLAPILLQSNKFGQQTTIVNYLATICYVPQLRTLVRPAHSSFMLFKMNERPSENNFVNIMELTFPEYDSNDSNQEYKCTSEETESPADAEQNKDKAKAGYLADYRAEARKFACVIISQWPCVVPSVAEFFGKILHGDSLLAAITPEWKRLSANWELSKFLEESQRILQRQPSSPDHCIQPDDQWRPSYKIRLQADRPKPSRCLARDLLTKSFLEDTVQEVVGDFVVPLPHRTVNESTLKEFMSQDSTPKEFKELGNMPKRFVFTNNELRCEYGKDLCTSLHALCKSVKDNVVAPPPMSLRPVRDLINHYQAQLRDEFLCIRASLLADDPVLPWLEAADLLPVITPVTLLEELRSISKTQFGPAVKSRLVKFGVLITDLQRQYRLQNAIMEGKKAQAKYEEEYLNVGHENWSPEEYCDWLLLEIDGSMLIRKDQVDVAMAVINQSSGRNSVLQMNMGKGKTSCIMPMAAAVLGNKQHLCRVIVPGALLNQSAETLQVRLGGLVGRVVRHVVYSRRTPTTPIMLGLYSKLHQDIMNDSGVLITTPEVVLSYQLSGKQCIADSNFGAAKAMLTCQSWLLDVSRDILDESDVSLAVKTQLIYPSGLQVAVDGGSHRWHVPQTLLGMVESHLSYVRAQLPSSIMVVQRHGGFPIVHFLKQDAERLLCSLLVDDICQGKLVFLRSVLSSEGQLTSGSPYDASSASSPHPGLSEDVRNLITDSNLDKDALERVLSAAGSERIAVNTTILLLRGLLNYGIFIVCLKKRWSVQYGLHLVRQPMAVPFEAKGVPSEQSEFGHPDVAINLTCLAFYYSGLTLQQFTVGLRLVLAADNPDVEYERWVGSTSLPPGLARCHAINLEDHNQVSELWKFLRFSRSVLHHYMNTSVFPVHAKQFPFKQQASGWDIPLMQIISTSARTTGFSGTNDNKKFLPLNIQQDDLPELHKLSAEVITYSLQERNRKFEVAPYSGKLFDAKKLLENLKRDGIRLLIDAGALILDMTNSDLAKEWLEIDCEAKAAVYFDSNNKAWVRYRGRKDPIPLLATPFVQDLGKCVVYLDQAHTRGVDLKFPRKACGAVTLALGQTKDNTVQAIMRLRQVATTQSVKFIAPLEVRQSIRDVCQIVDLNIDSSHVFFWLMEQTCQQNELQQGLFIAQGVEYCTSKDAEWKFNKEIANSAQRSAYAALIRRPERQSLGQLYGNEVQEINTSHKLTSPIIEDFMNTLERLRYTAEADGVSLTTLALEEVEQEREVEHQVEEVRVRQRPNHRKALEFPGKLHPSIVHFLKQGDLFGKDGFCQAFEALRQTTIGQKFSVLPTTSKLYVSTEYMRTVEVKEYDRGSDSYLRPVEWIVWSERSQKALIVIPEEAELILASLRMTLNPKTSLIVYSAPVSKRMTHFGNLDYYVYPKRVSSLEIPHQLSIDLGIFAGGTYMKYDEVAPLEEYLKAAHAAARFGSRGKQNQSARFFTTTPNDFIVEWLALRRHGQDISHTPLGYILQGRQMSADHPFFTFASLDNSDSDSSTEITTPRGSSGGDAHDPDVLDEEEADEDDLVYDYEVVEDDEKDV